MPKKDPRQYAKIAVDFPANRKLAGSDARVKWLDVAAVLWSSQNMTDGRVVPSVMAAMAGVPQKCATELIQRERWHRAGHKCPDCEQPGHRGEVVIHHYTLHQDSAETIMQNREKKRRSGREANHIRWKHAGEFEECETCHE